MGRFDQRTKHETTPQMSDLRPPQGHQSPRDNVTLLSHPRDNVTLLSEWRGLAVPPFTRGASLSLRNTLKNA
jgi:hypothetical protein